jgi:hypothetical protein
MNAAAAAIETNTSPSTPVGTSTSLAPALADLEDLLYDILASGADPNLGGKTLEAVQLFVHEHARSKKTHAEFVAFFEAQHLSMQPERTMLMSLPPLESRGRAAETPALAALPRAPEPAFVTTAASGRGKSILLWAVLSAAVSGMAGLACYAMLEVQDEFAQVRDEAARSAAELQSARAETETLRSELRKNAALLHEVEHKSDVLLQSFGSPLDPNVR